MKGLDAYLEGTNNPNSPANQTHWAEEFEPIINHCESITEAMLEEAATSERIGGLVAYVFERKLPSKWLGQQERHAFMREHAPELAKQLEAMLRAGLSVCSKCLGNGFTAEHDTNDPHIEGRCNSCPIQMPCEHCSAMGLVNNSAKL